MTDVTVATAAAPVAAPAIAEKSPPPAISQSEWTASDAARLLASRRQQKQAEPAQAPEPPQPEPQAVNELAAEANAAPQEIEATGETQEIDPAELPPLDLPRSWTKEQAEHWNALPRATQEYLAERASKDSAELRRVQNEAAEQRKAAEARAEQMEKARKEYEAKLPALMQLLQSKGEFADIRTLDDVKKLQSEDPFRFQAWQLHQMEMQAVNSELEQAERRKNEERQSKANERKSHHNKLLIEKFPEFEDPKKLKAAQDSAVKFFTEDLGFTQSDIAELGDITAADFTDDHRFQAIVYDAMRWRDAQKAKTAAVAKPTPPVVRPGTPKASTNSNASKLQALEREFATAPAHRQAKLMAEMRQLRRAGSTR